MLADNDGAHMHMQRLQESAHGADRDYRIGSPHLSHAHLAGRLLGVLYDTAAAIRTQGLPPTILEVGAGHGGYTEAMLAAGYRVTATEMSRPSLERLQSRYGNNPAFNGVFDADGSLTGIGPEKFSLVVAVSVIHHVPDYLSLLSGPVMDHLLPGGCFLSFQDPLWYPSVGRVTHAFDRMAYLLWRLPRGDYRKGFTSLARRLTGALDESSPSDMVEYHVIRNGVDHNAMKRLLEPAFGGIEIVPYWSSQAAIFQWLGERLARYNTFLLRASHFKGGGQGTAA